MTWPEVEARLVSLPRDQVVAFAADAARRVLDVIAADAGHYGTEAAEWRAALDQTVRTAERFAAGMPVTRFALDVAAETARCVAAALARLTQERGPGPHREQGELAAAAAAFAADAARASTDRRAATCAIQAARAADAIDGGDEPAAEVVAGLAE